MLYKLDKKITKNLKYIAKIISSQTEYQIFGCIIKMTNKTQVSAKRYNTRGYNIDTDGNVIKLFFVSKHF